MPARSIQTCVLLFVTFCCLSQFTAAIASDADDKVPAITWIQVTSENQFARAPHQNFIPLNVVQWSASATNRIRIEEGDHVFICDCPTGETLDLDLQKKTARRNREDRKPDLYQKLKRPLFERGVKTKGKGSILGRDATIFAWPNNPRSTGWCDSETGEMLYGEDRDPVNGRQQGISQVYFNYDYKARLDRSLFSLETPPGFKLVDEMSRQGH